ncbi:MAG: DNA methyltransferase [Nitratireductor sp.]|uniref:DNA methyltransferase n=2 Tax=Pseudomonadota TaxID=1224 RepID=UPI0032681A16
MAKKPKPPQDVESYKHDGAKRTMIPTAEQQGFVREEEARPIKLRWPRNPDLDPQLVWRGKDAEDAGDLYVDAPPVYIQEKIHPRAIIERLKRETAARREAAADMPDLFADFNGRPEDLEARTEFYAHEQNWQNRMILGDALMVMANLGERENLRGKVQCIYMDPPYGIKFNSNWQASATSTNVTDGKASDMSREPEVIRAFRDTWKDGINSYLSYLRDRLTVARDLLSETGSIYVQIGDENTHVVRSLLDEVFGPKNFISQIAFQTTTGFQTNFLSNMSDFVLWYAKDKDRAKFRTPFYRKSFVLGEGNARWLMFDDFTYRGVSAAERRAEVEVPQDVRPYQPDNLISQGRAKERQPFVFRGKKYDTWEKNSHWKANFPEGMERLAKAGRIHVAENSIRYVRYHTDFDAAVYGNMWTDTGSGNFTDDKIYVVQTNAKVIERCLLMASDPGDLVLDPTCGSGTTAYVAEQIGRRWITIDTSRVALALARARLMGARYPYYILRDTEEGAKKEAELSGKPIGSYSAKPDVRHGFVYDRAPHIKLETIANLAQIDAIWDEWQATLGPLLDELNTALGETWQEWTVPSKANEDWPEPVKEIHAKWWQARRRRQAEIDDAIAKAADDELLYDRPHENPKVVRVAGPFTVESLSPYRVIPSEDDPEILDMLRGEDGELPERLLPKEQTDFAQVVMEHLKKAGVQNTKKGERLEFDSIEPWPGKGYVAFEGRYEERGATRRAAIAIGPEYDAVGYEFVRRAALEARDAFDILIVCGFQFGPEVDDSMLNFGRLTVLKARMNQDIRMGDKLKNTGAGNLFVVFGEPDIAVRDAGEGKIEVEIKGVDIFDPTTGEVKSSNDPAEDIACWFIDDDYDEESFFVRQAYFLGGASGDPYKALKRALKAEIDEDAWSTLHTTVSAPFPRPDNGLICVKVINHFGDEVQKVFRV